MNPHKSIDRILAEQRECASYLLEPERCAAWAARYGCTVEQARRGALLGLGDWVMEEILEREEYERNKQN